MSRFVSLVAVVLYVSSSCGLRSVPVCCGAHTPAQLRLAHPWNQHRCKFREPPTSCLRTGSFRFCTLASLLKAVAKIKKRLESRKCTASLLPLFCQANLVDLISVDPEATQVQVLSLDRDDFERVVGSQPRALFLSWVLSSART